MNYLTSPIEELAAAVHHACAFGFKPIIYEDRDWDRYKSGDKSARILRERRPTKYDIEIIAMFPQMWGSTALGFGGIGGAAMTTAYTIVIRHGLEYCVYFGERFAYHVHDPAQLFFEDMSRHRMASVSEANAMYKPEEVEIPF